MVSCAHRIFDRIFQVPDGLLPILLIIALVVIYTLAKVLENVRKSAQQWQQVDKSKLKKWDDDEDD
jgi:hypothetical protein